VLEKFSFDVARKLLGKFWPYLVIAALAAALTWSRHDLGNARDKLADEAHFRDSMAHVLRYDHSDGPHLLYIAGERMVESENRRVALVTISDQASAAKTRSDAADAKLKAEQEANARKFAAAQHQIAALQARKPTGNSSKDASALEEDTKAAWKGWQ
jgi:hypothetical protein